jgi:hypothetical protein
MGLFSFQSLVERAQARETLVREAANAHTEATMAREALLQATVETAEENRHVNDAMAHQAEKEVNSLKKKLEVAQRKAMDVTDDL